VLVTVTLGVADTVKVGVDVGVAVALRVAVRVGVVVGVGLGVGGRSRFQTYHCELSETTRYDVNVSESLSRAANPSTAVGVGVAVSVGVGSHRAVAEHRTSARARRERMIRLLIHASLNGQRPGHGIPLSGNPGHEVGVVGV